MREQKKKEKEEELRKKKAAAEEKKAAAAQKKATAAAKRAAKSVSKSSVPEKRAATDNNINTGSEENQVTRKLQASLYALRDKQSRLDPALDSDAPSVSTPASTGDTSVKVKTVWQCSIYFEEYGEEDDEEWVISLISSLMLMAKNCFVPTCSV